MTPTPITDVQVIVKRIFTGIVYASGSPANPANIGGNSSSGSVALMGQMMIYMEILAIAIVILRFFYRAWQWTGEENIAKFSILARMIRIIMMDWFIIPLVIFASAIPMFFAQITPGALAPTCGLSSQVSQLGDALIRNMESAYTQFANGQMETALEQAKENNFSPDDVNSGYAALAKQFATAHKNYIDAADEQDSIKRTIATSSTDVTGQDPSLSSRLQVAQKKVQGASQALTQVQATLQGRMDSLAQTAQAATKLEDLHQADKAMHILGNSGYLGGGGGAPDAKALQEQADNTVKKDTGIFGVMVDASGKIAYFLEHAGFFVCMLPAILGILAGAVVCLKESIGILQYGAKLEILKNVGLSIACIFAPIFMLCFMWKQTEQFAWKFITFLFSIYFGFFTLAYVSGVVGGVGMGYIRNMLDAITVIPVHGYAQEASWDLFFGCVGIGLKGLGAGMITSFILDIIKSALHLGQGFFSGNFQAS